MLLILLFSKSAVFPKTMITFLACNIAFLTIDMILCRQLSSIEGDLGDDSMELTRTVVGALIWIPYFLKSERVKNTFKRN